MSATLFPPVRLAALASALSFACAGAALGQVVVVPSAPQIGSSNPVTAEPPISRPHTRPCVVPLFHELAFADLHPEDF